MPQNSPSSFISFLDSLDLFLDFGDTKINVLVKLRQLISSVFANAPNNVRLFVLPTAILYSGSTTQFRSVTKTIELKKSDSLDVYGADSIYDDVMDGLNARGYLYSLEGNQLTTNLMFRFFSKALGDSAKMVALSELRALKTQNKVSGLGVGLEMLPSLSAVKPLKGGDNFVYRGLNFHVSEDLNDFVFPNRLDELFGTPTDIINTVTYVGSNNKELVSFKDFVYSESS